MQEIVELNTLIVRHIAEIEAAVAQAKSSIDRELERAVATLMEDTRRELGWEGEIARTLDKEQWLAPGYWRTPGKTDDSFDLFINFITHDGAEDEGAETWLAYFVGVSGCGFALEVDTNALKPSQWKAFLRTEAQLVAALRDVGFTCDLKRGMLALPVTFDQATIAEAVENEHMQEALGPLADALATIARAKPLLDQVMESIRKSARVGAG